jgi:hypothetical protein
VLLYIPLVPSLNEMEGRVTYEYVGRIVIDAKSSCVDI